MMTLITGFTCPPTIYVKFLLQSATSVITKCDSFFLLQSLIVCYYKVRQLFLLQSAVVCYILQSATAFFITECDKGFYKVRQVLQSATGIRK